MDEKTHSTFGKVSLILGIISFLLLLLSPILLLFFWHTLMPFSSVLELSISSVLIYIENLFL